MLHTRLTASCITNIKQQSTTINMIKIVALLAFAAAASAGVVASAGFAYSSGPVYSAGPAYAHAPVAYAQPAYANVAAPVAYAQPAYAAYAAPAVQKVAYAAAPVHYAPQVAVAKTVVAAEPFDPNPQYNYGYSVSDGLTGDSKTASENLVNGVVQGQYSLVQPDGAVRTVTYTADDVNGFNAVVDTSAPATVVKAVQPVAKVAYAPPAYAHAPVAYAQPAFTKVAAPVAYASPAYAHAPVAHAQPAYASYAAPAYAHGPVAYHH